MSFRFAQVGSHTYAATADNLPDLKAKVECWFPAPRLTYRLDENGEGWAFWNGQQCGYIDQGEAK
jgi:hypothetical protein